MAAKKQNKKTNTKAKAKKKASSAKRKKTNARKKADSNGSLFGSFIRFSFKWGFIAFLWGLLFAGLITAWYAAELPKIIESPNIERRATRIIEDRNDKIIVRSGDVIGNHINVEELPEHVPAAFIAIEDRRFYDHFGIDPLGIARAMTRNVMAGKIAQGGSTITQQTAKNLFLSRERTLKRKIQEALLSIWLESNFSKNEILTIYLNRIYYGAGAYGIDAAANIYFQKNAAELNLNEAAMLAGIIKAPSRLSPSSNPDGAHQRMQVVLSAMKDNGFNTSNVQTSAKNQLGARQSNDNMHYFGDWIKDQANEIIGHTSQDIIIKTTLDKDLQNYAQNALKSHLSKNTDRNVTQGAILIINLDGEILSMVGGQSYNRSQFNRAAQAIRPPASAFKPIIYLSAFQHGWDAYDTIEDAPIRKGNYKPSNYNNEYKGEVSLHVALKDSLNTATIRLAKDVGINNILKTAGKSGIQTKLSRDLSLALGSSGMSMTDLIKPYLMIARKGSVSELTGIRTISTKSEELIFENKGDEQASSLFSDKAIDQLHEILKDVTSSGTGKAIGSLPFPAAGKTGTSQDHRDAWFIGYTDKYVAAIWVGNDDNSPMDDITGGNLPTKIWKDVMIKAHKLDNEGTYFALEKGQNAPSRSTTTGFNSVLDRLFGND